jgi:hypothetical protein
VPRGQEIAVWAGAWPRVGPANGTKALDTMNDRPVRGPAGWTEAASVLDADEDAASVHFGIQQAAS